VKLLADVEERSMVGVQEFPQAACGSQTSAAPVAGLSIAGNLGNLLSGYQTLTSVINLGYT
jgi:hypothetical protein